MLQSDRLLHKYSIYINTYMDRQYKSFMSCKTSNDAFSLEISTRVLILYQGANVVNQPFHDFFFTF